MQRAREEGWRSRAVFKLEEIQRSDHLLKPGMTVVDLGAAPGGWSQYAARILAGRGRVIAVDILPMAGLAGVEFLQGDFSEQATLDRLLELLDGARADLVLSDMAPNTWASRRWTMPARCIWWNSRRISPRRPCGPAAICW